MADLYVGLMSGTSLDGVDGVVLDCAGVHPRVISDASRPFPPALRAEMLKLNSPGADELHCAALASDQLARIYAQVVQDLLHQAGLPPSAVTAIGAHGQTVRHCPGGREGGTRSNLPAVGYTLQLNNPALLAELTGISVVGDFRSRDVAAGGQGAPLAPFFHAAMFSRPDSAVGVLNLGGIANLTVLLPQGTGDSTLLGFDCGPGNALMDHWVQRHLGAAYDDGGQWGASGLVQDDLLASFMKERYFSMAPPKSTGRDLFNAPWLEAHLAQIPGLCAQDVQATLCELTASSCADAVLRFASGVTELLVCGGGAYNRQLIDRLQQLLPQCSVVSTAARGLPPLQVEAAAFAWLARKTVRGEALALQSTTGARGSRVLGCIYPA